MMQWLTLWASVAFVAATPSAAETRELERPDGTRVTYHIDRAAEVGPQPILLLRQGSGCDAVAGNARVTGVAPLLARGHTVVTVEKYGVSPQASQGPLAEGCSAAYWRGNTLQQRVLDAAHVIAKLRGERWWNGSLILFGGSEGGATVAMLAPLVPEVDAVIVFSSGIGVSVGELIRSALPPTVVEEAKSVFAEAKANPSGDKRWGGASYRWWAEAIDVVPARSLLQTQAPVQLIHGSRDRSAPVASARATRDMMMRAGRRAFTYREYDGYDHFMTDAGGVDQRPAVLRDAADWLPKSAIKD